MSKVWFEEEMLCFHKFLKPVRIPVTEIVWGYLQIQNVETSMCCGRYNSELTRVVLQDRSGKQHVFEYEEKARARDFLKEMECKNPAMASGYTDDNKARFLKKS